MKKFLCVISSAVLLCGMLAACQKEPASTENDGISDILSPTNNANDILNGERGDEDLSPDDMAAVTTGFPSFAYAFAMIFFLLSTVTMNLTLPPGV